MLPSSRLGTQDYWESIYEREVTNFKDNGDEGEIWFGEQTMFQMVKFLDEMAEDGAIDHAVPIVDLGTGNGYVKRNGGTRDPQNAEA